MCKLLYALANLIWIVALVNV